MGAPALMMSPQGASAGKVRMELVEEGGEIGDLERGVEGIEGEISEPGGFIPTRIIGRHGKDSPSMLCRPR
ncbi:hypothetical protein HPP92_007524 [Vanilla planifolia]|uniref:Uncharacterized protein n=1 Tax=Vanilla planifolia TaxID=51239 RepID=A0A835VBX7_VANPL|nr:hypothetical protein HPP92_007524 [Vanilla planifolia]